MKCQTTRIFSIVIAVMLLAVSVARVDAGEPTGLSFVRMDEPKEKAFSLLVPKGWQAEGGIFRINALQAGGPINAMEAKCDLIYKSDAQGTVSFHILPDWVYVHVGAGGFLPAGSSYQGGKIRQIVDAPTLVQQLFTQLHPAASAVKPLKITRLAGEKQSLDQGLAYTNQLLAQVGMQGGMFQSDAAGGMFEYSENGIQYREVLVTGLVDMRAALTWKNTRTLAFRAPVGEFDQWRAVMDIMRFSIRFNPQWILQEAQGQRERAEIVEKIYKEIQRIDQEIVRKTTINREEIMNDNFLILTEQEEFVNPHTGEIEVDTDAYKHRWETPGGDIYYTNREDENPNTFLQRTDYQRTLVRKRRNEP